MTKLITRFCVCLLTLSALAVSTQAQDLEIRAPKKSDGPLEWKFKEGQVLKVDMKQDMTMEMDLGVQQSEVVNNSATEMTLWVKSVDADGVATMGNTIDRMVMQTEAPGVSFELDTMSEEEHDGPAADVAEVIKPMVGAEMSQKMSPRGEVTDVQIPESMMEGIENGDPAMAQMFNENTLKEMTAKNNLIFPDKELSQGATWNNVVETMMGPVSIKMETDYEYLGVTEVEGTPLHVIRGKIAMSFPDGVNGVDIDIAEEDSTIHFFFDGNAGRMTKSDMDQNVVMEIAAGPQTITQTIKQNVVVEFNEKK